MKKRVLSIFLLLSLVGCTTTNPSYSIEEVSSETTSEQTSEVTSVKESSISSEESTSEKVSSEEKSSVTTSASSSVSTTTSTSSEEVNVGDYDLGYGYHPSSEPSYNKQLRIFNHVGDMNSVWNHYRGKGVSLAVIDSGFDINHP